MKSDFWLEKWQANDIAFHEPEGNEALPTLWPRLGVSPTSTVFVPLCGKSVDLLWLARQGHRVIGVELSPLAVDASVRKCSSSELPACCWRPARATNRLPQRRNRPLPRSNRLLPRPNRAPPPRKSGSSTPGRKWTNWPTSAPRKPGR